MVVKTATCVPFEDSEVQQFFEKMHNVSTFFWVRDKKSKAFSRKDFFRVFLTGYRAFRGIGWGKQISLSKKFFLFGIIFLDWAISLSFCNFFNQFCQNSNLRSWTRETAKTNGEKMLFYQFRTLSRKNLAFQQNSKAWFAKV